MKSLNNNILATLSYADIFDYPLSEDEIFEWLIVLKTEEGRQKTDSRSQKTEDRKIFAHSLQLALHSYLIGIKEGFCYLKGRERIVALRKQREEWSRPKLQRAEKVAGIMRLIPWVKLVGVTGGLARMNADKKDDIDLFFIAAKNRLWLTRGVVVLLLSLLGLYRRKNKITDMICPNMFVSEDNLRMRPEDVYVAHEVCLMRPIFVRDDTYLFFIEANIWVKKFLPNIQRSKIYNLKSKIDKDQKAIPQILHFTFYILDIAEQLARQTQLWYMRHHRTIEIVSDNLIKFHPRDVREEILRKWHERMESYR